MARTRAERRFKKALIKKNILNRRNNQELADGGYYYARGEYVKGKYCHPHTWVAYTEEEIYQYTRRAFRCDGKRYIQWYGCGRTCAICNPHLFRGIKIKKVENTLNHFDMIDFEESLLDSDL